ncbi:MAG: class I SAM-dependent methyltransferase [Actinobacteria bacterium]|nr:class I SAM-dependent methyltransferase [Actinomycetota bacterium]
MTGCGAMRAATRWRRLVIARLEEAEALSPAKVPTGREFWDRRAHRFADRTAGTAAKDPFLRRVRRVVRADSHVVDVGSGPGRFALALAPHVRRVTAVDLSPVMISLVRRQAREQGLRNVRAVAASWQEAKVAPADVVMCSYVLPLIADAEAFLAKMEASREREHGVGFVYMNAMSGETVTDPLWRRFHGRPRRLGPTYLDALEVLRDLGLPAEAEVVEVATNTRFTSVAEATEQYADLLLLGDDPEANAELTRLLTGWLVGRPGALRPPLPVVPAAILRWPAASPANRP